MNKQRRAELRIALNYIEQAKDIINENKIKEEFAYDNLPEGFQYSDKGCNMEDNIENMDEAVDKIDEIISLISDVVI